jgi:cation transport ATPase
MKSDQQTISEPKISQQSLRDRLWETVVNIWSRRTSIIASFSVAAILLHLILRFGLHTGRAEIPLLATLALGGTPLVYELLRKLLRREFGSDLLAGISIVTSVLLGEYLAGSIVVLMLAGGEALEAYALKSASSVLRALAKRMPSLAHRKQGSEIVDVALDAIAVGETLVVYPHDICPLDGVVIEGHGVMDESFLTGEPFKITKTSGSTVISGAINGETALTIRTTKRAADSRYAKIMEVMPEEKRPRLRRLGDQLGAIYTPVAIALAILAWVISGEAVRFLAVMVIATPCPLLIAIPVAIIGSISLSARRGIIIKSPVVLEQVGGCRTAIFDKTGTLTYGEPKLTDQLIAPGFLQLEVLTLAASLERYSKHPLARAILAAAKDHRIQLRAATEVNEPPDAVAVSDDQSRTIVGFCLKKRFQGVLVLCSHGNAGYIHVAITHRDQAQIFLGYAFAARRKFGNRTKWSCLGTLSASVGIDLCIQQQDFDITSASEHMIEAAVTDVVSPAVSTDNPYAFAH